jgi:hypothetical protein
VWVRGKVSQVIAQGLPATEGLWLASKDSDRQEWEKGAFKRQQVSEGSLHLLGVRSVTSSLTVSEDGGITGCNSLRQASGLEGDQACGGMHFIRRQRK